MPGPEAEHTTCLNRRGRFAGGARKLIIGVVNVTFWGVHFSPLFGGWVGGWGGGWGVQNTPYLST